MCDTEALMQGMHGSRSSLAAFSVTTLALVLAPAAASASSHPGKPLRTARADESHTCAKPAVEVVAGTESATFPLELCDGEAIPASVDKLSILARPANAPRPREPLAAGKTRGADVAPGIRRIDARVAERLELVADHFRKEGQPLRILLAAPKSRNSGSYHVSGRALDFRIEGVENDALTAFCKSMHDTGCGYYPNEGFVHLDVRDTGAGHVSWIDVSRPGEAPRYVSTWPQPADAPKEASNTESAPEGKLPSLPAAATLAPMETSEPSEPADPPAPPRRKHRRHRHRRSGSTNHTI
jgi:hypothetical protein